MQIVERPDEPDLLPCFERAGLLAAPQVATKLTAASALGVLRPDSANSPASDPSPASPPSPSGIQTVSTLCPSAKAIKYRTVPSLDTNLFSIRAAPTVTPLLTSRSRNSCGNVEISANDSTRCRYTASMICLAR